MFNWNWILRINHRLQLRKHSSKDRSTRYTGPAFLLEAIHTPSAIIPVEDTDTIHQNWESTLDSAFEFAEDDTGIELDATSPLEMPAAEEIESEADFTEVSEINQSKFPEEALEDVPFLTLEAETEATSSELIEPESDLGVVVTNDAGEMLNHEGDTSDIQEFEEIEPFKLENSESSDSQIINERSEEANEETDISLNSEKMDEALVDRIIHENLVDNLETFPSVSAFNSGVFTVDQTGQVSLDFLFDGGQYQGELAIISLEEIEDCEIGSKAFIREAAGRALSNSELGYIVISDATEGARFSAELGEADYNEGAYLGVKTFTMRPGDKFGVMLVPNGTIQQVYDRPGAGGDLRPLFSMATANPADGYHIGQIADLTGNGNTFVMEDIRVDQGTDGDYNDIIFQVRGATGEAILMDDVVAAGKDWRSTDMGVALIEYVKPYETPNQPVVGLESDLEDLISELEELAGDLEEIDTEVEIEVGENESTSLETEVITDAVKPIQNISEDLPLVENTTNEVLEKIQSAVEVSESSLETVSVSDESISSDLTITDSTVEALEKSVDSALETSLEIADSTIEELKEPVDSLVKVSLENPEVETISEATVNQIDESVEISSNQVETISEVISETTQPNVLSHTQAIETAPENPEFQTISETTQPIETAPEIHEVETGVTIQEIAKPETTLEVIEVDTKTIIAGETVENSETLIAKQTPISEKIEVTTSQVKTEFEIVTKSAETTESQIESELETVSEPAEDHSDHEDDPFHIHEEISPTPLDLKTELITRLEGLTGLLKNPPSETVAVQITSVNSELITKLETVTQTLKNSPASPALNQVAETLITRVEEIILQAAPTPITPAPSVQFEFPVSDQPLLGIIDTGFAANNPDIDTSRITLGYDYVDGDDNPLLQPGEGSEHGTHNLGIIAATQNNNLGIDGINDNAPVWVSRAVGSGKWADALVEFVNAAKDSGQANAVVNLSLDLTQINPDGMITTRYELTPQERAAIEYARQHHVLIVAAAGNDGGVMSALGQASQEFDNIITVGAGERVNEEIALATAYNRANYSSYGQGLDILAPGGTVENPELSLSGEGVGLMAGTSVATAKVTGAVSQVWAANPDLSYRQVIEILKSTATDLITPNWDSQTGAGLLNMTAAVMLAKATTPEEYQVVPTIIPDTWTGEGIVQPFERASETIESFSLRVWPLGGVNLRNSPNYEDRGPYSIPQNTWLNFDAWTWGNVNIDPVTGGEDALYYRTWYNGQAYWVPSIWIEGYPPSNPPLLPPAQTATDNIVYLSTTEGLILQLDTTTGEQRQVYQGRAFTDLAVTSDGKLYGSTFESLFEIDLTLGSERYIGDFGEASINSLAFSPDGQLYGADEQNGDLFRISPETAQTTLIGNLGEPSSGDLVFNGASELFATVGRSSNDRLVAFDLNTGSVSTIAELGWGEVYGLVMQNGLLTAYTVNNEQLLIDPSTGSVRLQGTVESGSGIWGAANRLNTEVVDPPAPEPNPPSERPALPGQERVYFVRPDDTLWAIALRELGDGSRWVEITKPDGSTFTEAEARLIQEGQRIYLPVSYQTGTGVPVVPAPVTTPTPTTQAGFVNANVGSFPLNLRSAATTSAAILTTLPMNTNLTILGSVTGGAYSTPAGTRSDWYEVQVGSQRGYVAAYYVSTGSASTPPPPPTEPGYVNTNVGGGPLNMRSDATTAAGIVRTLPFGTNFTIIRAVTGGSYTTAVGTRSDWYEIEIDGQRGYVAGYYVDKGTYSGGSSGVGGWQHPLPGYPVTSEFGNRLSPITGVMEFHSGIDVAPGLGETPPVYAAKGGTVEFAGWNNAGYGNLVIIDHGDGTRSYYAHLSSIAVSAGNAVNGGTHIGNVGSTGNSTGNHLHFEIRVSPFQWQTNNRNPREYIQF